MMTLSSLCSREQTVLQLTNVLHVASLECSIAIRRSRLRRRVGTRRSFQCPCLQTGPFTQCRPVSRGSELMLPSLSLPLSVEVCIFRTRMQL